LKIVIDLSISSFSTVCLCCYITKTDLWNKKQEPAKINQKISDVVCTTMIGFTEAVVVTNGFLHFQFIHTLPHTWIQCNINIVLYVLLLEAFNYVYHRLMHTPYFFKRVHYKHHQERVVYPIDTFYMTFTDISLNVLVLALPVFFLQLNVMEYSVLTYLYVTGELLMHSNIISNHHLIHHYKMKGNYCFLFPIFDIMFNTELQE